MFAFTPNTPTKSPPAIFKASLTTEHPAAMTTSFLFYFYGERKICFLGKNVCQ